MSIAGELSRRLARSAEAVCRHYLPAGQRQGRYWIVGDVDNSPGRSLYVRLIGPESGEKAAGKWTDAQSGQHGDLLDLIAARERLFTLRDTLDEARRFLHEAPLPSAPVSPAPRNSPAAARRLFAAAKPLSGTLGSQYLRSRAITALPSSDALRFHPRCYRQPDPDEASPRKAWPALIAAVTDLAGTITGVQRTWLDPASGGKAPVASPRRELGNVHGGGVRLGATSAASIEVLVAGEGLETMLSLREAMPALPMVAAGSASHLDALLLPPGLRRLYIALDRDPAGRRATAGLIARATALGVDALRLTPDRADFNDDLRATGVDCLRLTLRSQLRDEDSARFLPG